MIVARQRSELLHDYCIAMPCDAANCSIYVLVPMSRLPTRRSSESAIYWQHYVKPYQKDACSCKCFTTRLFDRLGCLSKSKPRSRRTIASEIKQKCLRNNSKVQHDSSLLRTSFYEVLRCPLQLTLGSDAVLEEYSDQHIHDTIGPPHSP